MTERKNNKVLILLIVVVLVIVGLVGYYLINKSISTDPKVNEGTKKIVLYL